MFYSSLVHRIGIYQRGEFSRLMTFTQRAESSPHTHSLRFLALAVCSVLSCCFNALAQSSGATEPAKETQAAADNRVSLPDSAIQESNTQTPKPSGPLSIEDAVNLAVALASTFQQARFAESIAAEDLKQARVAFLPRVVSTLNGIYNSPVPGSRSADSTERFSFIAANAVTEYEALAGVTGDLDLAGRLRATLRRNGALLEAAHAGTEVARRALIQAVNEAYYGLALAAAKRRSAELTLAAAEEFERITTLLKNAGEVAEIDLNRAQLQTAGRRDEMEQAKANESVAADGLRALVGYDFAAPIAVNELSITLPDTTELDRFTSTAISRRPELAQLEAERRAAEQEARIARAERLPQVSYFVNGGFDTDSLKPSPLRMHTGVLAGVTITIPIFDWGASRSRERQAQLRSQNAQSQRALAQRTFAQQFYSARVQALSAAARVRITSASVIQAERNVGTSIARYRAGEAPILEVTDAQTVLATQRAALFQALFDYQVARTRLAQAAGQ